MELNKEQRLQKLLNEICYPNVEDRIKKGCQILTNFDGVVTLSQDGERYKGSKYFTCYGFDEEKGLPRSKSGNEILDFIGYPISLELIIAALEKKGYYYRIEKSYLIISGETPNYFVSDLAFTPLEPLPESSIDQLLSIFEN